MRVYSFIQPTKSQSYINLYESDDSNKMHHILVLSEKEKYTLHLYHSEAEAIKCVNRLQELDYAPIQLSPEVRNGFLYYPVKTILK